MKDLCKGSCTCRHHILQFLEFWNCIKSHGFADSKMAFISISGSCMRKSEAFSFALRLAAWSSAGLRIHEGGSSWASIPFACGVETGLEPAGLLLFGSSQLQNAHLLLPDDQGHAWGRTLNAAFAALWLPLMMPSNDHSRFCLETSIMHLSDCSHRSFSVAFFAAQQGISSHACV